MAAEKITYSDPTAQMIQVLTGLGGTKESSSTSTSASPAATGALNQILNNQLAGTTPQGAADLLKAIFETGMQQVPGLATTYAQAVGARAKGNSPFALAMQDMMARLTMEANKQLSGNQDAAARTAAALANATRSENRSARTSPKTSAMQLLPFALSNMGKIKPLLDKVGGMFGGSGNDAFPVFGSAGQIFDSGNFGGGYDFSAPDFGAGDALDLGGFGGPGSEPLADFLPIDTIDWGGADWATDSIEGVDLGQFFADGGLVRVPKKNMRAPGYASGGQVIASDVPVNIFDASGGQVPGITYTGNNATGPGTQAGKSSMRVSNRPRGGGSSQPTRQSTKNSDNSGKMVVADPRFSGGAGNISTAGPVDASPAAVGGFVAGIVSAITGLPAPVVSLAMNALNVPTMSLNPINQIANHTFKAAKNFLNPEEEMLAIQQAVDAATGGGMGGMGNVSPADVSMATGIEGANAGGLGGMGVSMGLDVGFDPGSVGGVAGSVGDAAAAGVGGGGFKQGGQVDGPGTSTSDSIVARLSDGEFVMNAESTKMFLPMLEVMNAMGLQQRGQGAQ